MQCGGRERSPMNNTTLLACAASPLLAWGIRKLIRGLENLFNLLPDGRLKRLLLWSSSGSRLQGDKR